MGTSEPRPNITVSEDRLRGVLAEFEIRLRDFLEDKMLHKADVVQLTDARKDIITLRADVNELKEWRAGQTSVATAKQWVGLAFGGGLVSASVAVLLHYL